MVAMFVNDKSLHWQRNVILLHHLGMLRYIFYLLHLFVLLLAFFICGGWGLGAGNFLFSFSLFLAHYLHWLGYLGEGHAPELQCLTLLPTKSVIKV